MIGPLKNMGERTWIGIKHNGAEEGRWDARRCVLVPQLCSGNGLAHPDVDGNEADTSDSALRAEAM